MKRRTMILNALKIAAAASLGIHTTRSKAITRSTPILTEKTGNLLRFPPLFTNGGTMSLSSSDVVVWPGTTTQVMAINGTYPGPTVRIQKGATFTATFVNQLAEHATAHWHGLIVPESMDGQPKDPVAPGASFTYTFPIIQRAGTYFYHSHAHDLTAKQVYKGFAGFFIIDDPAESTLGLPTGNFDVPLALQDRRIASQPRFTYSPTMMDVMNGYLGDTVLVNGTPDAYFDVSRTLYRFRLLNGSNARVYRIGFADDHQFHIIATDGGLKDEAVAATSFPLSPGERVDILMDFSSFAIGQSVLLESKSFSGGGVGQGTPMSIIRFVVTGTESSGGVVPSSMPAIRYYNASEVARTRAFTLSMGMGMSGIHKINNLSYALNRIDAEVPKNELEEWRMINTSTVFHPMHIHGVLFQVLSRNGSTNLPPTDRGWKDTVLVNPAETVRLLAKFTDYAGIYLMHCHNLEHEDDGMMLNFRVNDPTRVESDDENAPSHFRLYQNYPNPFNPKTTISFDIPEASHVEVDVFDVNGKKVATLVNQTANPGRHSLEFTAINSRGMHLPSGTYFARMKSGRFVQSVKMILAK